MKEIQLFSSGFFGGLQPAIILVAIQLLKHITSVSSNRDVHIITGVSWLAYLRSIGALKRKMGQLKGKIGGKQENKGQEK